jgi:sugar phosphate isomerase/epimerase
MSLFFRKSCVSAVAALVCGLFVYSLYAEGASKETPSAGSIWAKDNLFAWCVVPFDAKRRNSQKRAEMFNQLGIKSFAYDWRAKDIPTFDEEIETMKSHHIKIIAWWFPYDASDPGAKATLETFKKHDIHPLLWVVQSFHGMPTNQQEWAPYLPAGMKMPMTPEETAALTPEGKEAVRKAHAAVEEKLNGPTKSPEEQEARVQQTALRIQALENLANEYGTTVDLYNHNGWFGEEDNELAVLARLKTMGVTGVGMVYNFSHLRDSSHDDTKVFPEIWAKIKDHVVAVDVTGIDSKGDEVYPSQGDSDMRLMRTIEDSGWRGPVGIIAEKGGDAEVTLRNYMIGVTWIANELKKPGSGGPAPFPPAP